MLESIAALVRTGRIVEFALAIVAVEAVVLIVRKDRLGGASALFKALAHLASGAFLMIALWCALTDQAWRLHQGHYQNSPKTELSTP